ncbi:glycosyltransferase family 4 protein [Vibrio owensii]|uniref:glycosyltransferase family 4 protein n=1 Tax=Vibrio owensii TaxID=696485 RepID=UPI00148D17FC|nr:glycosyltransferase family 4 protein [Vibrio owensii]
MRLGIYANWKVFPVENGFYIEGLNKKYLDKFANKSKQITLLCSTSRNKDIPENFEFISFLDVELIELPYFKSYLGAARKISSIWRGMKDLLSVSDFIYIRTPEPFSWFAAILKKHQILNYHFTSNPLEILKGRMKESFIKSMFQILLFYPEYILICISAYFNRCSANGSSVLNNVPFFLKNKINVLVESTLSDDDDFSLPNCLPNSKFRFLCVSRLKKGKGLDLLIEAFYKIKEEKLYDSLSLAIVGSGPEYTHLVSLVNRLGLENEVKFLGFVSNGVELNKVYQKHNIYVNPSISETGPRTLIEALYNNLYCISTDVGYVKDILDGNHELGITVRANDSLALYDGLKNLLDSYDISLVNKVNRRYRCKEYTLETFVDKVLQNNV